MALGVTVQPCSKGSLATDLADVHEHARHAIPGLATARRAVPAEGCASALDEP